jgi:hypothetical protein
MGWASLLPQRTTKRLLTIAAFLSSSNSTTLCSLSLSRAINGQIEYLLNECVKQRKKTNKKQDE